MTADDPSMPYGAIGGEGRASSLPPPPTAPQQWHPGEPVVVRPNKFVTAGCAIAAVVIPAIMATQDLGLPFVWWLLGAVLVFVLIVAVESVVGEVRVDNRGISRRSLRGSRRYLREELENPVLHRYMRASRSGRHETLRLTVRRAGGRYGFQITADLYSTSDVDRIAGLVHAVRTSERRPIDVERRYPGSTRLWQRHSWLPFLAVLLVTWVVLGFVVATL